MLMARVSDGSKRVSLLGPTQTVCKTLFKYIFYVQGCFVSVCDARARAPATNAFRLLPRIIIIVGVLGISPPKKGWATTPGMNKLARGGPCWKKREQSSLSQK